MNKIVGMFEEMKVAQASTNTTLQEQKQAMDERFTLIQQDVSAVNNNVENMKVEIDRLKELVNEHDTVIKGGGGGYIK